MRLKRSSFLIIAIILLIPAFTLSQADYNNPESAVFDSQNNCYYISNTGDGKIIKVDANNTNSKSILNSDLTSVRGLCLIGNTLYAAADEGVVFISLPLGSVTQTINIIGMGFLNDITGDDSGDVLYISDTGTGKIYKLVISSSNVETIVSGLSSPNGLYWDGDNNRLIFVPMVNQSSIKAINMLDRSIETIRNTANLARPDGITRDMFGNYYISYWTVNTNGSEGFVVRAPSDFSGDSWDIVSSGHSGPADIFFRNTSSAGKIGNINETNESTGILVIPNWNVHTVSFKELSNLTTADRGVSVPSEFSLHQNFPNPFNPNTSISYDISKESSVKLTVFDLLGSEIVQLVNQVEQPGSKVVQWDGRNQKGELVNGGLYLYKLEIGDYIETRKMVLLK